MERKSLFPKSWFHRENKAALEAKVDHYLQFFVDNFEIQITNMFGVRFDSRLLTLEEQTDIINFARFGIKRLVTGMVYSDRYHKDMKGSSKLLSSFASLPGLGSDLIGHDLMHAVTAYIRSGGKSLTPRFLKVSSNKEVYQDPEVGLEEAYTLIISEMESSVNRNTGILRNLFKRIHTASDEGLQQLLHVEGLDVSEFMKLYKEDFPEFCVRFVEHFARHSLNFGPKDQEFYRKHRPAELKTYAVNLYKDATAETPDPKFVVHEFMRMLEPLLDRLRRELDHKTPL